MTVPSHPYASLRGKVALVTGASSGLGAHLAKVLARAGCRVAVCARREDRLRAVCEAIAAEGGTARPYAMDVTDRASVDAAVAAIVAAEGGIDVLVNNAGIAATDTFLAMSEADWAKVIDTDLTGVWRVGQAVARAMAEAGSGSIVNVASILGLAVQRRQANYAVAKAGVCQLTRVMALELRDKGIRVNAIAPGYFETEINADFFAGEAGQAYLTRLLPKRLGEASELDGAVLLLASEAGSFINGVILPVDGGTLLKGL